MKSFFNDQGAVVRVSWLLVVAIATLSVFTIFLPGCASINDTKTQANIAYGDAVRNEKTVEEAGRLQIVRSRVENDLRHLSGQQDEGRVVAAALRLFNDEGKHYHVEIRTIIPAAAAPAASATLPPFAPASPMPGAQSTNPFDGLDPLVGQPVTLGMRGDFRDIIGLLTDLPKHDVLIDVRDVQMTSTTEDQPSSRPALNVTVQATLFRVRSRVFSEENNASSASR